MTRCKDRLYTKILWERKPPFRGEILYLYNPAYATDPDQGLLERMFCKSRIPDPVQLGPTAQSRFDLYTFDRLVHLRLAALFIADNGQPHLEIEWLLNAHKRP